MCDAVEKMSLSSQLIKELAQQRLSLHKDLSLRLLEFVVLCVEFLRGIQRAEHVNDRMMVGNSIV